VSAGVKYITAVAHGSLGVKVEIISVKVYQCRGSPSLHTFVSELPQRALRVSRQLLKAHVLSVDETCSGDGIGGSRKLARNIAQNKTCTIVSSSIKFASFAFVAMCFIYEMQLTPHLVKCS
jgi:hypothetical protein